MAIDLESQLREVGRALDARTSPVSVAEVRVRPRHTDAFPSSVHDDLVQPPTATRNNHRWLLLVAAVTILVAGMIGAIALLDRSSDPSPVVSDDGRAASAPTVDSAARVPSTVEASARELAVTITPALSTQPRPDVFPIVSDPDAVNVFGQYVADGVALSATTVLSRANSDGPSVTVSLSNPLDALAAGDDVLERTEVNGAPAWSVETPGGHTIIWQVSETTWAQARVRGGPDETVTLAKSVEYAAAVEFVDETEWRSTYRVAEPTFGNGDAVVGIDAGSADGAEVGMLVEVAGVPIGKLTTVTDATSDVLLATDPDFSVDATVSATTSTSNTAECRVRGGNDHVGYVCARPLNEHEQPGAEVVATGLPSTIVDGTTLGRITSIVDINGEQVALLDLLTELPIAGDAATVIIPA